MHIVDLDGARLGLSNHRGLTASLAARTSASLQVGGGVRSAADIELLLAAGVARVVIGSVALERPAEVNGWLERFGSDRMCLAFDVRSAGLVPQVRTHGWTMASGISLWDAIAPYTRSACHVLCTDIVRDGTLFGPNLHLYYQATTRFPQFRWQASGGIRSASDLNALKIVGVQAAISGKALLEERIPIQELKPFLPAASSPASTSATAGS
jgi:phosphoribosylformimino-5-aminoimidazole carboxamide ribotide isomerase